MGIRSKSEALQLLGLSQGATKREVNEAYRALAKMLHPDNTTESDVNPRFYEIQDAYDYLMKNWDAQPSNVIRSTDFRHRDSRGFARSNSSSMNGGPRVFGDSGTHASFQEHKADVRKKERADSLKRREREERYMKLAEEGRKERLKREEEQRKKESVIRAMKSIRAILAAKVIEDYLDDKK